MDPGGVGKALAEKAMSMGATFKQTGVRVIRPAPEGGWVVETDTGALDRPTVVVAAGVWSARLLKPLGINVTRIAYGIPVGGNLEFADQATIGKALKGRQQM